MIGVLEGFFGPAWKNQQRISYATFLKEEQAQFYIYAPKSDPYLRKQWRKSFPLEKKQELKALSQHFRAHQIQFGVGLSPFELHGQFGDENKGLLNRKLDELVEIGIDLLGVFFDDMVGGPKLAEEQTEILNFIRQRIPSCQILFCPTYYSDDPILDRVFGQRPEGYLEEISQLPPEIQVMWTGPKVISREISESHLEQVAGILRRKPFLWDNLFANDGPKNCQFLKLFSPEGRTRRLIELSSGWALNPMNQAELSKISFLSLLLSFRGEQDTFATATERLCPPGLSQWLQSHAEQFLNQGFSAMSGPQRQSLLNELKTLAPDHPIANDVQRWLAGEFIVDSECLTD